MTNRFFIAILLFFCAVTNARAIETINGCEFDSLNGKWYQLEDNILYWEVVDTLIMVKFESSTTQEQIDSLFQEKSCTVLRHSIVNGFWDLTFSGSDPIEMVKDFENESVVEIAHPVTKPEELTLTSDPFSDDQWNLLQEIYDADVDYERVMNDIGMGESDVIVAIIGYGFEWKHPDLLKNTWNNFGEDADGDGIIMDCFGNLDMGDQNHIDDDGNGYVDDVIGMNVFYPCGLEPADEVYCNGDHETCCAGIIGAETDNAYCLAGIAGGWDGKYPVKLCNAVISDVWGTADGSAFDDAVDYAVAAGAKVISISWGLAAYNPAMDESIDKAYTHGVFICASSGNKYKCQDGEGGWNIINTSYPANHEHVCAVGATDYRDDRSYWWYNYPCHYGSVYGDSLDLVAPGSDIYLLDRMSSSSAGYSSSDICILNGTSFSAPHVAGVAALLLSNVPFLTVYDIHYILENTADRILYSSFEDPDDEEDYDYWIDEYDDYIYRNENGNNGWNLYVRYIRVVYKIGMLILKKTGGIPWSFTSGHD